LELAPIKDSANYYPSGFLFSVEKKTAISGCELEKAALKWGCEEKETYNS